MVGSIEGEAIETAIGIQARTWSSRHADRAMMVTLAVLFGFTIIKAASTDITYDEGYTFLFYGRSALGWAKLDLANNHPLNSLLIFFASRAFGTSDLVVRLPNVLAGAIYYLSCATLLRCTRLRLIAFPICALQIYFLDYFSLARGYGIAVALVQFGLVQYFWVEKGRRRYPLLLGAILLASLSIFSTAVLLYALIAAHAVCAARVGRSVGEPLSTALRQDRIAPLFLVLSLIPAAGLLWVSRSGLPLYASQTNSFAAVFTDIARMYVAPDLSSMAVMAAALMLIALALAFRRALSERTVILLLAVTLVLALVYVAARVFGRPLPAGRVFLPWLPLANLAVISLAEDIAAAVSAGEQKWLQLSSGVLFVAISWSFCTRLHFTSTNDWKFFANLQPRLIQALADAKCLPPDVAADYGASLYYMRRWFPDPQRPLPPPCQNP